MGILTLVWVSAVPSAWVGTMYHYYYYYYYYHYYYYCHYYYYYYYYYYGCKHFVSGG